MIRSLGPPDSKTPGNVGDIYQDIATGTLYRCLDITTPPTEQQFIEVVSRSAGTIYEWAPYVEEDTLAKFIEVRDGAYLFYQSNNTPVFPINPAYITRCTTLSNAFYNNRFDVVPDLDLPNVTDLENAFNGCTNLVTVGKLNTPALTSFTRAFSGCTSLSSIESIDLRNVANGSRDGDYEFTGCTSLTYVGLRNIQCGLNLSACTLLTTECLIRIIYETCKAPTLSRYMNLGTANKDKLADVYVRLITVTDAMREEDDLIDLKKPFELCQSTDEGAMLILDYLDNDLNYTIM